MMNQSEHDRRTLRLGGIAVGAIVFLMLAGLPALDYWDRLNRELDQTQKKITAKEAAIQEAASGTQAVRELRRKATIHADADAASRQTAVMVQQVESLPGYRSISVQRMEGLPLTDEDTFLRSAVSLQFSGHLTGLYRFLRDVESAEPALKVDRLTLTAGQKDNSRVEGRLLISAYGLVAGKRSKG